MELHCFASENQTYTGTWLLALSLVFKGQENLLLKNLQVKTRVENVRFLSWRIFFVGKYGIQSTNEMAFKRIVTLRASFRFPAIRFDAPTLLSFSGFTHAHAKCPPVMWHCFHLSAVLKHAQRWRVSWITSIRLGRLKKRPVRNDLGTGLNGPLPTGCVSKADSS